MLTWPCCLRMVAITDVTSKALTSKCLRLKCSDESNVSNRKRLLCLYTDVPGHALQKRFYQSASGATQGLIAS